MGKGYYKIRLRYVLAVVAIAGTIGTASVMLPPPQCDLLDNCTDGVAALNKNFGQ